MMAPRLCTVVAILTFWVVGWPVHPGKVAVQARDADAAPRLINTCVITSDVKRLVDFYRNCAENPVVQGGDVERGERSSPYSGALLLDVLANDGDGCAAAAS
jgi:hypothetical protein